MLTEAFLINAYVKELHDDYCMVVIIMQPVFSALPHILGCSIQKLDNNEEMLNAVILMLLQLDVSAKCKKWMWFSSSYYFQ